MKCKCDCAKRVTETRINERESEKVSFVVVAIENATQGTGTPFGLGFISTSAAKNKKKTRMKNGKNYPDDS